jgi:hypothetical protein
VPTRRVFLLALVGYFLLGSAWALALPVNGTYDEKQHLVRAYSVWTGQFIPTQRTTDAGGLPTDAVEGPRSLLPENPDCTWRPKPPMPASCQRPVTDRTRTLMPTSAGRYSPVYYLAVGLPLRLSPDETGLIWARLISAALGAVFLAAATALAVRLGKRLLVAGIVLVSTPLAMDLNGSINPNGLEITSGVLLFVALLSALMTPPETSPWRRWLIAGVAFAVLAAALHLGIVLGGLAFLACLLMAGRRRTLEVLRDRTAWLFFGVPAVAGSAYAVIWLLASSVADIITPARPADPMGLGEIVRGLLTSRADFYARQVIAQFGYGETTVSLAMIGLWYLLVAAVILPVLWRPAEAAFGRASGITADATPEPAEAAFGRASGITAWRVRIAIVGILVASYAILAALEIHFVPLVGWYAHSRYIMPLGAGAILCAAFAGRLPDRLILVLVALTVPLDLYALARVMTRFQVGIDAGLHPFGGSWHPPLGSVVPLVACLVGGALLIVTIGIPTVRAVPEHSTANTLSY